jgi:hypothetical protein
MKLIDVIRHVNEADGMTICVRRPWSANSDACLVSVAPMSKIPEQIIDDGYEYFLEGSVLREVLEMPEAERASDEGKVNLAVYYAENDAYPPLLYER